MTAAAPRAEARSGAEPGERARRDAFERAAGAPHLLHAFSTFVPAGPEMRAVRLIEAMGAEFRHSVLAMDGRTDAARELSADAPFRLLASPPRDGSLATVRRLRALLRRERPDALLTYNWGAFDAVLAARSLGLGSRVLHHEDGFNADEAEGFKRRRVWTRRLVLPGVHRIFVPSRNLERIARELWRLAPEQIAYVPNGVSLERFAPRDGRPELRAELGIPTDAVVVAAMGHLRPVKNYGRLLEALARVDAALGLHLVLIGDGEQRASLADRARTLGLEGRTHFAGHRADPRPFLRLADVFALSSDSEQMPVALLEAMACALPVVATAVGDVPEILPDALGSGVHDLSTPDLEGVLAASLERLARDPERRAELGRAARARVEERYALPAMVAAHRSLWRGVARR